MRAFASITFAAVAAAGTPGNEEKFQEFLARHKRSYASEEERAAKFAVFVENLEHIARHQDKDEGDAAYSHLSPFADITTEEFSHRHGLRFPEGFELGRSGQAPALKANDLPVSFDWREKGAVNDVKDQAACGSCWAFATVANIEGAAFAAAGKLVSLSEQELVDCDKGEGDMGCNGGLPKQAYKYLIDHKTGLEFEADYAYNGRDGKCKDKKAKNQAFVGGWTAISKDEDQMAAALMQYGPLAIGINAAFMQFYFGGIATYPQHPLNLCTPTALDHGVAIVGFGNGYGVLHQKKKNYWTIRNSWGPSWGEKGYYRIVRGFGMCGLNTMVTTATNVTLKAAAEDILVV